MNCQIFETVVNDLAREQMIEAGTRKQALAHSSECENCGLRLERERRLTHGLHALAVEMNSVSASSRVEENLLEAFRAQASLRSDSGQRNTKRYWLVAAAAMVLMVLGVAMMRWQLAGPSHTAVETNIDVKSKSSPAPSPVVSQHPNPDSGPTQTATFAPKRKQLLKRSRRSSSSRNDVAKRLNVPEAPSSEPVEIATQFLPLSYMSQVSLQDGGQLVRVELPRSAMAQFGLPVNMERHGEKVKADVLVSADGLARAIRFVQ